MADPLEDGPLTPSLSNALDSAELVFRSCWDKLVILKERTTSEMTSFNPSQFQSDLANALFELDKKYREALQVRNSLLGEKETPDFLSQIRVLAIEQNALSETMAIGRAIGDAFAWLFYCNSQELLAKHLAHPPQRHTPPGLGGLGELGFISSVTSDTHFVLYHGITTFLRIGDVSFIEHETLKATSIGEIKTRMNTNDEAVIELHTVSGTKDGLPKKFWQTRPPILYAPKAAFAYKEKISSKDFFELKLKKQLPEMGKLLAGNAVDLVSEVHNGYAFLDLTSLAASMMKSDGAHIRVGDGLLLTALRISHSKKLSEKLLRFNTDENIIEPVADIAEHVMKILDPQSKNNRIESGTITPQIVCGFAPPFWWPVDSVFLEQFYFGDILLMSQYNSLFLCQKLRDAGFRVDEIAHDNHVSVEVTFREDKREGKVENFAFFIRLVRHQLMREETLVEIMRRLRSEAPKDGEYKIKLNLVHRLF